MVLVRLDVCAHRLFFFDSLSISYAAAVQYSKDFLSIGCLVMTVGSRLVYFDGIFIYIVVM